MRRALVLALLLVVLAAPAAARADKEIVTCQTGDCFSPATVTMDQGERLDFRNADLVKRHDVQHKSANPLFAAPTIEAGSTAFVEGSQYLTAGEYPFVCTLHTGMDGTLIVTANGTPQPRPGGGGGGGAPSGDATAPAVKLRAGRVRAAKVARSRRIAAVVQADEQAKVVLSAFVGGRRLGSSRELEVFGGTPTDVTVRLSRRSARQLRKGRKLTLRAVATDAAGNAGRASVTKTLG